MGASFLIAPLFLLAMASAQAGESTGTPYERCSISINEAFVKYNITDKTDPWSSEAESDQMKIDQELGGTVSPGASNPVGTNLFVLTIRINALVVNANEAFDEDIYEIMSSFIFGSGTKRKAQRIQNRIDSLNEVVHACQQVISEEHIDALMIRFRKLQMRLDSFKKTGFDIPDGEKDY